MIKEAYFITAKDLADKGKENIPKEFISSTHLIYSSPATLSFNSPGAQGFGVKRAGLAVPGSVMLLVAPGCCGRNTTILSELGGYSDKFFFLLQDETDIVTGRHLNKISDAVKEVCDSLETKPTVVMLCITCVDALLGTDMDRVCKKATKAAGIPVLPCYMYALTREGRKPPMVFVRETIYSLLEPDEKQLDTVNLLGNFAPLTDDCELYALLGQLGIKKVNEISRCKTFEEYKAMSKANFNLVLNPEARLAAETMQKKLDIPSAELTRLYQLDKIKNQYDIFAKALGASFDDKKYYHEALAAVDDLKQSYPDLTFAIGETVNANPIELSLALLRYGFKVSEIYASPTKEDFVYIKKIAQLSPQTKIYTNLSPTMIYYNVSDKKADITIGKDAEYYHPDCVNVPWNLEIQPFGYTGVKHLFEEIKQAAKSAKESGR